MTKQGIVTSKSNGKCRVLIKDLNYETGLLPIATHIDYETLNIDDNVVIAFFNTQQTQGAVIAKI
jgi:hypothetical protein